MRHARAAVAFLLMLRRASANNITETKSTAAPTAPATAGPRRRIPILDFTPHLGSDVPHSVLPDQVVRDRVDLVATYARGIRTFACYNGAAAIRHAKRHHKMTTAAGAWMDGTRPKSESESELECLISLAREGVVDLAVVGSETVTWNGLTVDRIVRYVETFRRSVPDVPVTTAEKYEALIRPENEPIINAVDVLYVNFYPFWTGHHVDDALDVLKDEYAHIVSTSHGKKDVWISETGWPSDGSCPVGRAVPSAENQRQYLRDVLDWTEEEGVVLTWFDAFEQPWKNGTEYCNVASHWGIFDADGIVKPGVADVLGFEEGGDVNNATAQGPEDEASPEAGTVGPAGEQLAEFLARLSVLVTAETRTFLDPALIAISVSNAAATFLSWAVVDAPFRFRPQPPGWIQHLAVAVLSGAAGGLDDGVWTGAALASLVLWAGFATTASLLPRLNPQGAILISLCVARVLILAPYGYFLLRDLGYPSWFLRLYVGGSAVALLSAPHALLIQLAQDSLLTHGRFVRPHSLRPAQKSGPKVSVHVPTHAEPSEIVISTLEHLAALDYDNYEVLVCDNNTEDEGLWRPVEAACVRLNEELGRDVFRFFHVMDIRGAKAGALNWLLDRSAEDVELVALVDADYQADACWLGCLVGFFEDDGNVGFVQTSHDYRDQGDSLYKSMCYWEYMPNYKVALASVNEYDAGFTVGTMCLFRRAALEKAGRWAEWCLTEDSEIAVRLRHVGYEGIYVRDTLGRGLIPQCFEDYRRQRFRWTAGPVQQLLRHWRKYLPCAKTEMSSWAKFLEIQHSLQELSVLSTPVALFFALVLSALIVIGILPTVYLPRAAWLSIFISLPGHLVRLWLQYKLADAANISQMVGGFVARQSLFLVRIVAATKGLFSKHLAWKRTPKFDCAGGSVRAALWATLPETLTGIGLAAIAVLCLTSVPALGEQVTGLLTIAFLQASVRFLCAPAFALVREIEMIIAFTSLKNSEKLLTGGKEGEAARGSKTASEVQTQGPEITFDIISESTNNEESFESHATT